MTHLHTKKFITAIKNPNKLSELKTKLKCANIYQEVNNMTVSRQRCKTFFLMMILTELQIMILLPFRKKYKTFFPPTTLGIDKTFNEKCLLAKISLYDKAKHLADTAPTLF